MTEVGRGRIGLTDARRKAIVDLLARGVAKKAIAQKFNIGETTLYDWLKRERDLEEAAERRQEVLYNRAIDELDSMAFGKVQLTAEVKLKSLLRIIDSYEDKMRRQAGEATMDGAHLVLMKISAVLLKLPEARSLVLEAFSDARDEIGLGDGRSGIVPPTTLEGEPAGAGPMADERGEDYLP